MTSDCTGPLSKPSRVVGGVAVVIGIWWVVGTYASGIRILDGYAVRPYTLFERLITQPRALVLYLSLIFFPMPYRLSLQHNLVHSSSLIEPWTTLPSIMLVAALIVVALIRLRKNPILCFSILFFFMCHAVESSVLPLELVFEHRNYLPSMFLFWPVGVGLLKCMSYLKTRRPRLIVVACAMLFIMGSGLIAATYARNAVWADECSIWEDAAKKGDKFDRPLIYLAKCSYQAGDIARALYLYGQAHQKYSERKKDYSFVILNNTANIFFDIGNYAKAVEIWHYTADRVMDNKIVRKNLAIAYARLGEPGNAINQVDLALKFSPRAAELHTLKIHYLLKAERFAEAIEAAESAHEYGYDGRSVKAVQAMASFRLGDYLKCKEILESKYQAQPTTETLIWLLATNLALKDAWGIEQSRSDISKSDIDTLRQWIERIQEAEYPLSGESLLLEELNKILDRRTAA
jgi:protein O-mannosyl-transferase